MTSTPHSPSPLYDPLGAIDTLAPGVVVQEALLDAVTAQYVANGYTPLTAAQMATVAAAAGSPLPALPAGLPRFPDSNEAIDGWTVCNPSGWT